MHYISSSMWKWPGEMGARRQISASAPCRWLPGGDSFCGDLIGTEFFGVSSHKCPPPPFPLSTWKWWRWCPDCRGRQTAGQCLCQTPDSRWRWWLTARRRGCSAVWPPRRDAGGVHSTPAWNVTSHADFITDIAGTAFYFCNVRSTLFWNNLGVCSFMTNISSATVKVIFSDNSEMFMDYFPIRRNNIKFKTQYFNFPCFHHCPHTFDIGDNFVHS